MRAGCVNQDEKVNNDLLVETMKKAQNPEEVKKRQSLNLKTIMQRGKFESKKI